MAEKELAKYKLLKPSEDAPQEPDDPEPEPEPEPNQTQSQLQILSQLLSLWKLWTL